MPHEPAIPLPALCPREAVHVARGHSTGRFTAALFVRATKKTTHMPTNKRTGHTVCCVQTTDRCASVEMNYIYYRL